MLTVGSLKNNDDSISDHYGLLWNNVELDDEKVNAFSLRDGRIFAHLYEDIVPLDDLSLECIAGNICELELNYFNQVNGEVKSIEFVLGEHYKKKGVRYEIFFDSETWNFPWSIQEYANELLEYGDSNQNLELHIVQEDPDFVSNGFYFYRSGIPSGSFSEFVRQDLSVINNVLTRAREKLIIKSRPHALVTWFEFPEAIKNSCAQYLIYFGEFLKDIGINANAEISEISDKVLFSVVPKNKEEGIEKVRVALNVFLQLPLYTFPDQAGPVYTEISVQKMRAQILHLQSQLLLNNVAFDDPSQKQSGVLLNSVEYSVVDGRKEEKEDLFGGMISITKYKGKGFEIDLPGIIRKLRAIVSDK